MSMPSELADYDIIMSQISVKGSRSHGQTGAVKKRNPHTKIYVAKFGTWAIFEA